MINHKIDKLFNDLVFKTDHSCKNIGRILRLPGTTNYKRKIKHGLEPALCKIIQEQDVDAPITFRLEQHRENSIKKIASEEIKSNMKNVSDDQLEMILKLPIEDLVKKFCGIELQADKKNFKSPKD
jgi:hypothetical protein